jgi:beta-glucanase (GH16 family)
MKIFAPLLFLSALVHAEPPPGYAPKWADEFDGTQLDVDKWKHWLPGKRRDATNHPDAVTVADGKLTISTYTEGGRHFTGMISTQGLFEPRFGYFEARIKWKDAPGTWSAFWSQSPTMGKPVGDVATAGMEIDFAEHREVDHEGKPQPGKVNFTLHWDGYGKDHKGSGHITPDLHLGEDFHVYGFEWTADAYRFFIDGKKLWEVRKPISQREQFLILSSEVDNSAWSHHIPEGGYGDRAHCETKLVVDYVRCYEKRP